MNILRDVAGGLFKMFVSDAWLAVAILVVVSLTGLLTGSGAVPPLLGGAALFVGCILVLVASVVLASRRSHR
jgi:hypothetical protein